MTWTISMTGHDDLSGDEKVKFEEGLVEKARALAQELSSTDGCNVTTAYAATNTTGQKSLV